MSNKLVILWGIIVILIFSLVFVIGKYYNSKEEYILADNKVKEYIKEYLINENIKIKFLDEYKINSKMLDNKSYYEEISINDMECTFNSIIKNYIIFKTYNIDYNCVNEIIE